MGVARKGEIQKLKLMASILKSNNPTPGLLKTREMGEAASCANGNKAAGRPKKIKCAFTAVLNPGRGIDVLCEAQPVKLKCQNSKMVLQTYSYLPKG